MQKQKTSLDDFSMLSLIGFGNYAKVVLVRKKSSGKLYALKIVKKSPPYNSEKLLSTNKQHAFIQKKILQMCSHPFIVNLHSTFQHNMKLYYVLQYCPGGQLFGLVKRCKRLNQQSSRFYACQILHALEYLHTRKIIYRDLKPQNVLIDEKGYARLVDFGLSLQKGDVMQEKEQQKQSEIAGTPQYLPPQIFISKPQEIGYQVDWWCLGNIIFQMMVGFPAFFKQNQSPSDMKYRILTEEPPLHLISSNVLKDLLSRLLCKDPKKRLGRKGAYQIKQHQWFKIVPWEEIIHKRMKPPFIPKLKSDIDTSFFDQQNEISDNRSPSDEDLEGIQNYKEFSLSWKSSDRCQQSPPNISAGQASPPEISLQIQGDQHQEEDKYN